MRATDGRGASRVALWVFLAASTFYITITRGHFISTDEIAVYHATRSLWETGDLSTGAVGGTVAGRDGRYYAMFNAGQSVLALPLFALGRVTLRVLERAQATDWIATLAGPSIGVEPNRWSGDVEIFFTNLLNCFVTGWLCALFFTFELRLGVAPRWALAATGLLALTSYIAPFSTTFFQHSAESLFLVLAFYWLVADSRSPQRRARVSAGCAAGALLLVRFPSAIALPGLLLYLVMNAWRRSGERTIQRKLADLTRTIVPFALPVVIALALHGCVQYVKFGTIRFTGGYAEARFDAPLLTSLYGYLFSPGDSLILLTPLLVLAPWTHREFARHYRSEAFAIAGLFASYLVFYGKVEFWHGMWCFGPRYLAAMVPMLLLPLGGWMQARGHRVWFVVMPLALVGLWMQLIHVAVNFWWVVREEGYSDFQPPFGFLFHIATSPILAHSRALLAWDWRVDTWIVNVYREFGAAWTATLVVPFFAALVLCLLGLRASVRALELTPPDTGRRLSPRPVVIGIGLIVAAMVLARVWDAQPRAVSSPQFRLDLRECGTDMACDGAPIQFERDK